MKQQRVDLQLADDGEGGYGEMITVDATAVVAVMDLDTGCAVVLAGVPYSIPVRQSRAFVLELLDGSFEIL